MKCLIRDKTLFSFDDVGAGWPTFLLVHGWACDHNFLAPQIEHFSRFYRVIAPDLCGHGKSRAPQRNYTVAQFANDFAWLCRELRVERVFLVGHSMGGLVAFGLAATYPDVAAGVCRIDSVIFPSKAFRAQLKALGDRLAGSEYAQNLQLAADSLFIETDNTTRRARLLTQMAPETLFISLRARYIRTRTLVRHREGCW